MSRCPECGAKLKPLFNSEFCPNECDTPAGKAHIAQIKAHLKLEELKRAKDAEDQAYGYWFPPLVN